jgi:3-oxoacyl-[acyl-carrier protein] reductase
MSSKLSGKVAVVTGASKGIGAEIARQLAAEGASVVVNYASSRSGADKVVNDITSRDGKAIAVQADVSKPADVKRLFAETKKAFGRLDVLVNNAGIYNFAPLEQITPEHFQKHFELNVLGLILATQEAIKHFEPEGGSIVNLSSVVSTAFLPGMGVSARLVSAWQTCSVPRLLDKEWRSRMRSHGSTCLTSTGCWRRPVKTLSTSRSRMHIHTRRREISSRRSRASSRRQSSESARLVARSIKK